MAEVPPPLLSATSEISTSAPGRCFCAPRRVGGVLSGGFFGGKTAGETILVAVKNSRVEVKL